MTKIEWATETWNPVVGCRKISPGCLNCYAERMARRLKAMGRAKYQDVIGPDGWTGKIGMDKFSNRVMPIRWKKPRRIFVCSMGDLFHEAVSIAYLEAVFRVILSKACTRHTFMILTKRPENMQQQLKHIFARIFADYEMKNHRLPDNVWLGVTAENQEQADKRIPILLQIPAAVRFVSIEPMLGPVDISKYLECESCISPQVHWCVDPVLNWVIAGGESGPGARPVHPDWVRRVRDDCQAAGVPFFFKQWGEWAPGELAEGKTLYRYVSSGIPVGFTYFKKRISFDNVDSYSGPTCAWRVGKKQAGRLLDGRTWDEYPKQGARGQGPGVSPAGPQPHDGSGSLNLAADPVDPVNPVNHVQKTREG